MNLFDANLKRAQFFAAAVARRLPDAGLWTGYTADEPLVGELRTAQMLTYWRRDYPHAVLVFDNPVMHDIKEVDWGEEVILEANVTERATEDLAFAEGVTFDETISHTFSATRSLLEAAKVGAELAIKSSVNAEYAGVKGGIEVDAKISAEYSRQWGEQSTQTDTVSRHVVIPGPWKGRYEAVRSLNKTQREISARTDFEFNRVGFIDETGAGVNPPRIYINLPSWTEFLAIGQGIAPADRPLYHQFIGNRLTDAELAVLSGPSDEVVKWLAEYDNVLHQDISIL